MRSRLVSTDEIRRHGKETVGFLHRSFVEPRKELDRSVAAHGSIARLEDLGVFPRLGRTWSEVLSTVETNIIPCIDSEKLKGPWTIQTSMPAILSEPIINSMGAVGLQWASCPILTDMEVVVMDALASAVGLRGDFKHSSGKGGGLIQNTSADSLLAVIVAARVRKRIQNYLGKTDPVESGIEEVLSDPEKSAQIYSDDIAAMRVYSSTESQRSVWKACAAAGIDLRNVPVTSDFSMDVDALEAMIAEDRSQSSIPALCIASFGTELTGVVDNIKAIGQICHREGMWFHVDASYGGGALLIDGNEVERMHINQYADSINMTGSLWLPTGLDMDFLWVKDKQRMTAAFAATGDYLPQASKTNAAPTLSSWSIPLGRQFRSLRLWCVLQYYGIHELKRCIQDRVASTISVRDSLVANEHLKERIQLPIMSSRFGFLCFVCENAIPGTVVELLHRQGIIVRSVGERNDHRVYQAFGRGTTAWSHPDELGREGFRTSWEKNWCDTMDMIVRYLESVGERLVRDPELKPGSSAEHLENNGVLTEKGRSWVAILSDIEKLVIPGMCHWQHPKFLAFFPSKTSTPVILMEPIVTALGGVGNRVLAEHSEIENELEISTMDALAKGLQLGEDFMHSSGKGGGIVQNTASDALVVVIAAAKTRMKMKMLAETNMEHEQSGGVSKLRFVVYTSEQTHFCTEKACRTAGVRLRKIATSRDETGNFPMNISLLKETIVEDRRLGFLPILCVANYGATNTCAVDPVHELGDLCRREGIMLHVDAAYSGSALMLEAFRDDALVIRTNVDSININGSKWLGTGFHSAFLWVKDRRYFTKTFGAEDESEGASLSNWSLPTYSKWRALRIWAVLQYFGIDHLRASISHDIECAQRLREKLKLDGTTNGQLDLTITNRFGLVCFTAVPHSLNSRILKEAEKDGFLIYPSKLVDGTPIIRVAFGSPFTTFSDVDLLFSSIQKALCSS